MAKSSNSNLMGTLVKDSPKLSGALWLKVGKEKYELPFTVQLKEGGKYAFLSMPDYQGILALDGSMKTAKATSLNNDAIADLFPEMSDVVAKLKALPKDVLISLLGLDSGGTVPTATKSKRGGGGKPRDFSNLAPAKGTRFTSNKDGQTYESMGYDSSTNKLKRKNVDSGSVDEVGVSGRFWTDNKKAN